MTSVSVDDNFMLYHNSPKMKIEKIYAEEKYLFFRRRICKNGKTEPVMQDRLMNKQGNSCSESGWRTAEIRSDIFVNLN